MGLGRALVQVFLRRGVRGWIAVFCYGSRSMLVASCAVVSLASTILSRLRRGPLTRRRFPSHQWWMAFCCEGSYCQVSTQSCRAFVPYAPLLRRFVLPS